jgi:hypothetical protein
MDSSKFLCRSLIAALCLVMAACNGDADRVPPPEPVEFEAVAQGRNSRFDALTETRIRDVETWATVQESLRPVGTVEQVNFFEQEVLLVAMPVSSGGYDLEIERIERRDDHTRVHYIVHEPGEDCMTAQVMLTPFAAAAIPRTDDEVTFHARTLQYSCSVRQH